MKKGTQAHYCTLPELFSALSHVVTEIKTGLSTTLDRTSSLQGELDKVEKLRA